MKVGRYLMLVVVAVVAGTGMGYAQPVAPGLEAYNTLMTQINADIMAGKHTEAEFADDLRKYDALLDSQKGQDPRMLAFITMQKGILYFKVLENPAKASAIFQGIQANYPNTPVAAQMDAVLKELAPQVALQKTRESLASGTLLPDFTGTNLDGGPLSIAQYRGKVVLIDFWATWCPPCRRELPNVVAVYQKYHAQGFEIIGVTLDDAGDRAKLVSFMKDSQMTWPEKFEGNGWANTLTARYGVAGIPDNILLDGQGRVLGRALRGDDLDQAVAKALAK